MIGEYRNYILGTQMMPRILNRLALLLIGLGFAMLFVSAFLPNAIMVEAILLGGLLWELGAAFWFGYMAASDTSIPVPVHPFRWMTKESHPRRYYAVYGFFVLIFIVLAINFAAALFARLVR
jgi:hypothetical protein